MKKVKEIRALQQCQKKYDLSMKGIQMEGFEKLHFIKLALAFMVSLMKQGKEEIEREITTLFQENFLKEWFNCSVQWETCMERDLKRVLRIYRYIVDMGYKVLNQTETYELSFNKPLSLREQSIRGIEGKFDILLEKSGKVTGVLFETGEPVYSKKARKQENLPENSLELVSAYAGAYYKFQQPFAVELWYVKNKDDKGVILIDTFEHREGKNIVKFDFSKLSKEELNKHFFSVLKLKKEKDCKNCKYSSLCNHNVCTVEKAVDTSKTEKTEQEPKKAATPTEKQQEIIEFVNGQMCVVAVPGAGKTFTLVKRMIHLIENGVKPSKILFVSFTKKAAKEIDERVEKELAQIGVFKKPAISTYNGLGFSILRDNPMYVGRRIKTASDTDRYGVILKALENAPRIQGVSYDGLFEEYGLIRSLDRWFTEIQESGEEVFSSRNQTKDVESILSVYYTYKKMYDEEGFISFDMQISMVNELFERYPVLAKRYAEKYEYIMVDEFQDTCEEQAAMIYEIARYHGNLVVVGDDDQSIYQWRGGSSRFMLEFQKDFPEARMVYMQDNFRSGNKIISASNALIKNNGNRFEKKLISHLEDAGEPVLLRGVQRDYLKKVVTTALKHGYKPGDLAILARDNRRLEEVQTILKDIVPVTTPKDFMVKDTAFLAIYHCLNLYYNGLDNDESFYLLFSYRGQEEILQKENSQESFYQNLVNQEYMLPIKKGSAECIAEYDICSEENEYMAMGYSIVKCFEKIQFDKIEAALETILNEFLRVEEHMVVENLIDICNDRGIVKMQELFKVMHEMILFNSQDRVGYDVSSNAVNLLTCHDAKGKEFPTVIIFGIEDFDESEEEIRVLYVAMTRAMRNLYLMETSRSKYDTMKRILSHVRVMGGN